MTSDTFEEMAKIGALQTLQIQGESGHEQQLPAELGVREEGDAPVEKR